METTNKELVAMTPLKLVKTGERLTNRRKQRCELLHAFSCVSTL